MTSAPEPPASSQSPAPPTPTPTQKYLFWGGVACLLIALVLAGVAVIGGWEDGQADGAADGPATSATESSTPPAAGVTTTSTTASAVTTSTPGPETTSPEGPAPGDEDGAEPPQTTPSTEDEDERPPEEQPPADDLVVPDEGSDLERVRAVAEQVDFPVLYLDRSGWTLTLLEAGRDGAGSPIVVVIYEQSGDFININQRAEGEQPPLGGEVRQVQARGTTIEVQDMNGVSLARWNENGATILVSSTLSGDRLIRLLEALQTVPD